MESLEPFDEHEEWHGKCSHYFILTASQGALMEQALLPQASVSPVPSIGPSWTSTRLNVCTVPVCLEGLGLASTWIRPEVVLLTGGSSRGGRMTETRSLIRGQEGWRSIGVEASADLGVRLYHTITCLPGGGAVVYGGRSSPLRPTCDLFKVKFDPGGPPSAAQSQCPDAEKLRVEPINCTGNPPPPRWRHTAAVVSHRDCCSFTLCYSFTLSLLLCLLSLCFLSFTLFRTFSPPFAFPLPSPFFLWCFFLFLSLQWHIFSIF
ncbi:hypothetical protein GOODEAATRI_027612 [Goodea atripinnis]|uniref:RAG2 n=1 Tax=Goodea atripinnis TaxID=208336 RepID=A0ABV0NR68_9TELE